ncbi:MAG: aspartyl protease family protein [Dokdonella sp.]
MFEQIGPIWMAAALLLTAGAARADDAAALFARNKEASGGVRWDGVKSLQSVGTLSAGGLSGEFHAMQDLSSGRSSDRYKLGPVEGADGYDGRQAWQRDPGGEVAALDAVEAKRRARSQAWLDARGYWYPSRIAAKTAPPEPRDLDGKQYVVVVATPDDGEPLALWFDAQTHLLARTVQRQGQDAQTTTFDDWRNVDGLSLPFHAVNDVTDAAGRTDPRQRSEVRIERYALNVAVADADFAMPAMEVTARIDNASGIARIPFELVNNHIYVSGSIEGKPARLMVDTGGINLLTPAAAKKFGLAGEGRLAARGVGDDAIDLSMAHAQELRVGDALLAKPVFYIVDLGDLPKVEGVEADGLVGYEMFRRFGVTIDYAARMLTLAEPKKFTPPAGAHAVPFELDDHIPIVDGQLDGLPLRISIDTGSRASLTLHSPFVRSHDLAAKYHAAPDSVVGWGVGGASHGRPARFGELKLGDVAIAGVAGDLYLGDKGSFANPDLGGNLGGGVLRRFTVAFDYDAKRMYLAPNADFAKLDAFDRSGLWLLGDGDALKIAAIAPQSAAQNAGLRENDRITRIGDEAIASHTLADWRARLRDTPVGSRLAIELIRSGKIERVDLTLADRIPAH